MIMYALDCIMKEIAIELSKEAYLPGERIEGAVKLSIDKPVSARSVKLLFAGSERTRITRSHGKTSSTYREKNTMVKEAIILHSPAYENDMELEPGNYVFEFDFVLPEYALPSYSGRHVTIGYNLKANVDVPWWFDIDAKRPVYVFRSRDPLGLLQKPVRFASNNYSFMQSNKPSFLVELRKNGFIAGEGIDGTVLLKNMYASNLRKIYVHLIGAEFAQAQGRTEYKHPFKYRIEIPVNDMAEGVPRMFRFPIPKNIPSSYEGRYSYFRWGLEVGLDIPIAFDVKAVHPVEILR
jgi:hypothetical protein